MPTAQPETRRLTVTDNTLDRKPTLRLAGKWLAAAGFPPGCRVEVDASVPGRLVIARSEMLS